MKKALALLCSLALIFGVFCACAKNDPNEGASSSSGQSTASSSAAAESKNSTAPASKEDGSAESSTESTNQTSTASTAVSTTSRESRLSFPSFDTEDIFGAKISSKVFSENKLTVVNVFTTWCEPCKLELPELAKLDKELEDVGFLGIVIDIDEGDGVNESALRTAKDLCNEYGAAYPYLITNGALTEFCREIYTVPTTYFVDKDGKIVGDPIVGPTSASMWKDFIEQKLEMA